MSVPIRALVLAAALIMCAPMLRAADAGRNLLIFVADGLRAGSVTREETPTMYALAREGVLFANSHAVVPTLTTPNAAAIATGHLPGDTGDFGNSLYPGFQIFNTGNFGKLWGSPTPFVESDAVLADLDDHFGGNWLGEESLLAVARAHGYSTAAIGKVGPVALQDVSQLAPHEGQFVAPQTIIIDDATGSPGGVPLTDEVAAALRAAGLPTTTPVRVQPAGDSRHAGTHSTNYGQQAYFIEATTRALLPLLQQRVRPFALVYWSRDPDATQHSQGDSLNALLPGINGPTSKAAIRNADDNLRQLLEALRSVPGLAANTDVFVTSDHGFATISKREVDARHHATASYAATLEYRDVPNGFLPPGFLAIDLAHELQMPIFDPEQIVEDSRGPRFRSVHPGAGGAPDEPQHPQSGSALLGGTGIRGPNDVQVIVAANGGSDLIYLQHRDPVMLQRVVEALARQDYVGALFVDDDYGAVAGTLPLSAIGLRGTSTLPRPAILVGFRRFTVDRSDARRSPNPLQNAAQIADTTLQQGQGMHGAISRDNTYNFMAATGPDFKAGLVDRAPAGNADIAPTLAAMLGWTLPAKGPLSGRVLEEARNTSHGLPPWNDCTDVSPPAADGRRTVLRYQLAADRRYVDESEYSTDSRLRAGCHARH